MHGASGACASGDTVARATVRVALRLEASGAAALCLHGRARRARDHGGACDWATVRAVARRVRVPLITNG